MRVLLATLVLSACSGPSGSSNPDSRSDDDLDDDEPVGGAHDPGTGTRTFAASALFTHRQETAKPDRSEFFVQVSDADPTIDVAALAVTVTTARGAVVLSLSGEPPQVAFRGFQPGGGGTYRLEIDGGPDHALIAALEMPALPVLATPDPTQILDAHAAALFDIAWVGALAPRVAGAVKGGNYEWEGPDTGTEQVRADVFKDTAQTIEVRRIDEVELAGAKYGAIIGHAETATELLIVNPW